TLVLSERQPGRPNSACREKWEKRRDLQVIQVPQGRMSEQEIADRENEAAEDGKPAGRRHRCERHEREQCEGDTNATEGFLEQHVPSLAENLGKPIDGVRIVDR